MTRINRIRLANVNYNNDHIHVEDKVFDLNSQDTLMVLANGGGKSVFVQLLSSLFVSTRYKSREARPFDSYFTSKDPTYIFVEWELDHEAGYVLTGAMIRKNQQDDAEIKKLEQINIVHSYRRYGKYDIANIDLYNTKQGKRTWKTYNESKRMFEELSHDHLIEFDQYDIPRKQKDYFEKLKEFKINHEEWETIMHPINKGESGLKNLFKDCKSERDLIEKWFIPVIEKKLNVHQDKMDAFQKNLLNQTKHLKEVESKLKQKDITEQYIASLTTLLEQARAYEDTIQQVEDNQIDLQSYVSALKAASSKTSNELETITKTIEDLEVQINEVNMQKDASKIYQTMAKLEQELQLLDTINANVSMYKQQVEQDERSIHLCECHMRHKDIEELKRRLAKVNAQIQIKEKENEDLQPERNRLGYFIKEYYNKQLDVLKDQLATLEKNQQEDAKRTSQLESTQQTNQDVIRKNELKLKEIEVKNEHYSILEATFNQTYNESLACNVFGELEESLVQEVKDGIQSSMQQNLAQQAETNTKIQTTTAAIEDANTSLQDYRKKVHEVEIELQQLQRDLQDAEEAISLRKTIMQYLSLNEQLLFNKDELLQSLTQSIHMHEASLKDFQQKLHDLQQQKDGLEHGEVIRLEPGLVKELSEHNIPYIYGMDWLEKQKLTFKQKKDLIKKHPFLPYALILDETSIQKLQSLQGKQYTSFPIPIIQRNELEESLHTNKDLNVYQYDGIRFYIHFNESRLDPKKLKEMIQELNESITSLLDTIHEKAATIDFYQQKKYELNRQTLTKESYERIKQEIANKKFFLEQKAFKEKEFLDTIQDFKVSLQNAQKELVDLQTKMQFFMQKEIKLNELLKAYEGFNERMKVKLQLEQSNQTLGKELEDIKRELQVLQTRKEEAIVLVLQCKNDYKDKTEKQAEFASFEEVKLDEDILFDEQTFIDFYARYQAINTKFSKDLNQLYEDQTSLNQDITSKQSSFDMYRLNIAKIEDDVYLDDAYIEEHLPMYQESKQTHTKLFDVETSKQDKQKDTVTRLDQKQKDATERFLRKYNRDTLLEEEKILVQDFDAKINSLKEEKQLFEQQIKVNEERVHAYNHHVARLDSYKQQESIAKEFSKDVYNLPLNELEDIANRFIQTCKRLEKDINLHKATLLEEITRIDHTPKFQLDSFMKSLTSIRSYIEQKQPVYEQLAQLIECHTTILKSLLLDVETQLREKESFVNELLEYVRDMNLNMSKIDAASNVDLDGKSHKLFQIHTPLFEENKETYLQKMTSYVDHMIQEGFVLLDANESIEEYIKASLTASMLYDHVIGLNTIEIKIYKIEDSRRYKIDWSEVVKSSGGEGFVSAFIVLSCLLQFMRKKDDDLFKSFQEGKVLLMDNPFAVLQSEHLIKPMMDLAKKTNTQLICLSAVNSVSAYFDNVYVMSIHSNVYHGKDILTAEQTKGQKTLKSTNIEASETEQLRLF